MTESAHLKTENNECAQLLRQFIILPVVLGILLFCIGALGIFVSRYSTSQIRRIHNSALRPTLAFEEIINHLNIVEKNYLRIKQTGLSQEEKKKILEKNFSELTKIERLAVSQFQDSSTTSYEGYLKSWLSDWRSFVAECQSKKSIAEAEKAASLIDQQISLLILRMNNINEFIETDAQVILMDTTSYAIKTNWLVMFALVVGVAIGLFASIIVIFNIKENSKRMDEARTKLVGYAKMSALGEMAGGIAHEINNPLTIIKTTGAQLQELVGDQDVDKAMLISRIEKIVKGADRVAKIVNGLKAFSRDGSADPFLPINLEQLVANTLTLCQDRLKREAIQLKLGVIDKSLIFLGRETQISQVLVNLMNNSCDAIAKDTNKWIEIAVSTQGPNLTISLTDSGLGIPLAIQQKMFQPFFTTKEIGKGTGLGLSISINILKAHGGQLSIDNSCPNTRFVLSIPLAKENQHIPPLAVA